MDIALKKPDLVQRLSSIRDEAALQWVTEVIEKKAAAVEEDDGISDEECAAFNEEIARCGHGGIGFHSEEGSSRMVREGLQTTTG